jgi:hypothetical protein
VRPTIPHSRSHPKISSTSPARRPDGLDLARVLDGALGLHELSSGHELDPVGHDGEEAPVLAHGDAGLLEAHAQLPVRPAVPERARELLRALLAVEVRDLGRRPARRSGNP